MSVRLDFYWAGILPLAFLLLPYTAKDLLALHANKRCVMPYSLVVISIVSCESPLP